MGLIHLSRSVIIYSWAPFYVDLLTQINPLTKGEEYCTKINSLLGGTRMNKSIAFGILIPVMLFLQVSPALANKPVASIEGSTGVAKGTEVTLRVTVTHNTNSPSHYTEWLKVMANKKEIARWDYTKDKRPEAAEFTKEIKIKVMENTEIIAEAHCNIHGSNGPVTHHITVK
jgi:desulfoferrodoxin (superoxide reductase-like protein)